MADVYISSTFKDLKDCRRQVSATLRRIHHSDVAMEHYGAEDSRPLDRCLADVAACDLYICIVAWRYGFIPEGYTKSITELEYRQAVESGKPRLVFLLAEDASWPKSRFEMPAYNRVEAFREELRKDRMVAEFMDETDLGRRVSEAIYNWERREGRAPPEGRADWESYRRAVFDTHRWVRLAVIAGAKQDRSFAEIPLTEVFVTQPVQAGPPEYDVPDDPSRRDLHFNSAVAAAAASDDNDSEEAEPLLETSPELRGALTEPSLEVLGREYQQVFLGAPGSGKSTLLLDAMLLLCDTERDPATLPTALRHAPLPFFIELRQYVLDRATSFVDYLTASAARQYGVEIDAESIQAVLAANQRALVMFDGLDEVFDPRAQAQVVDEFRSFARRHPDIQLVVTSRIAGYRALELERDGFRHYTLLGFGMPEIRQFVPKWYTYYTWQGDVRNASGLIRRISESPRLLELAGNPLLLTMMAVIYKHQDLPEKRWQLYARCVEVLLEDWDVKRKNIDRNLLLPLGFTMVADQKAELLQRVSVYMLEHRLAGSELNAIARTPLLDILATYLQEQYSKPAGEARAVASEILDHLRERTYIIAEIGEHRFGFVHRTFMEFLAAEFCKAEFNRREADYDWLTHELFGTRWQQDEWREVLLLLIAMLKDQGSPVRKVIDHLRQEDVQGLPAQLTFAARCLAEAGTADDAWSRSLVAQLVNIICTVALQPNDAATQSFLDDALGSFALLASTVSLSQKIRRSIDQLGQAQVLRARMVSFQLQLALRSKEDRLTFALEALDDPEEAVRRGAIAAIEREWPGREDVFSSLLNVLRKDRLARVRLAALRALDRSWPPDIEILQALDDRAAMETAYTFIIDVMRYLSRRWGGNRRALEILAKFAERRRGSSINYDATAVRKAAIQAIVEGWRHASDFQEMLQDLSRDADEQIALIALMALAQGWPDDPEMTTWIRAQLSDESNHLRGTALVLMLRARTADQDLQSWARQQAIDEQDPFVRVDVISALSFEKGDAEGLAWLQERLLADSTAIVRRRLMEVWAATEPVSDTRTSLLRDRAIRDEDGLVRSRALQLLLMDNADDPSVETLLRDRLDNDDDALVRMTALWAFARTRVNRSEPSIVPELINYFDPSRFIEMQRPKRRLSPSDLKSLSGTMAMTLAGFISELYDYSYEYPAGLQSQHDPEKYNLDFLMQAATQDADAAVRLYATMLVTLLSPLSEMSRALLNRRLAEEGDPEVRDAVLRISQEIGRLPRYTRLVQLPEDDNLIPES